MTKPKHINLHLDTARLALLNDLCLNLEMTQTQVIYELIRIQHARLASYLRARPLPPDARLELTRDGDFTTYGPLPKTKEEARKRLRHFYGAYLLDERIASDLNRLAQAAKLPPHKLLADMVEYWTKKAIGVQAGATPAEGETSE